MSKELTEKWRSCTLTNGVYYLQYDNCLPFIYNSYQMIDLKKCKDSGKVEVLAPVPSYEEYKALKDKLEIATKALKEIEKKSDKFDDSMGVLDQLDLLKAICQETLYHIEELK